MKSIKTWSAVIALLLLLTPAYGQTPQTAAEYLKRGIAHKANKQFLPAMNEFNKAIELDANLAEAYYHRGTVELDTQKAIADFTKAIQLNPDYAEAYYRRGLSNDFKNEAAALLDYTIAINSSVA